MFDWLKFLKQIFYFKRQKFISNYVNKIGLFNVGNTLVDTTSSLPLFTPRLKGIYLKKKKENKLNKSPIN